MNSVVVLQARTNSSRLPAKVLLPVAGYPLVILAAKRAANTGRMLIVATSDEESDDGLAALLAKEKLTYFRGSLENTLQRIVRALSSFDDQTIVFRLTADNFFPDGPLLDEIEKDFIEGGFQYLVCNGIESGVPHGLSVEVTYLQHLRDAEIKATSIHDQEHVTPFVARKFGVAHYTRHLKMEAGHFRCTIDCLDDYIGLQGIFGSDEDPINISALELVRRLRLAKGQPSTRRPASKLVLGTAQLGMDYGIANYSGKPDRRISEQLIKTAIINGVVHLDTARGYGDSEDVIGQALAGGWHGRASLITKLSPDIKLTNAASKSMIEAAVDASVFQSCFALRVRRIDVMLLHRYDHLHAAAGGVWRRLLALRQKGVIGALGVSVQNPIELEAALRHDDVMHIQLPMNVLDWRWATAVDLIQKVKSSRELIIHIRSPLLQGLLVSDDESLWRRANVAQGADVRRWLMTLSSDLARIDVADLCLAYVRGIDWVDGVALGMEKVDQLKFNLRYFDQPPLTRSQIELIESTRPIVSVDTLDPANWRR